MASDIFQRFLLGSTSDRLSILRKQPECHDDLRQRLGDRAFQDYLTLAQQIDDKHLSIDHSPNLIFVPGVMGSLLGSQKRGGVWWIDLRGLKYIDQLALSPNGDQDLDPQNEVVPFTTEMSYDPFLSAVLARDDFGHVLFPYDWRKPLEHSTAAFRELVLGCYEKNNHEPVNIVVHSMGGLLTRAALLKYGPELWPRIHRIVFLATPHYGATAIASYLKNHLWGFELMALLGKYLSRATFRSLWGVLSLLPAPRGVYPGTRPSDATPWRSGDANDAHPHPCCNFDLYQADNWRLGLTSQETDALQKVLTGVADFHERLAKWHFGLSQLNRDKMLVIAGVGHKTMFRLAYQPECFGLWEKAVKTTSRVPGDPHREGDGSVPLASAALEYVTIRYVRGKHGAIPNIPQVYEEVFRYLNGEDLQLPETAAAALSQHLGPADGSAAPYLDGTKSFAADEETNLWNEQPIPAERLAELDRDVQQGLRPEFTRLKLL